MSGYQLTEERRKEAIKHWAMVICLEMGLNKHDHGEILAEQLEALVECTRRDAALPRDGSPQSPWQPIETAPRDGTAFLMFNLDWSSRIQIGRWYRGRLRPAGEDGWDKSPTHWMAIPPMPSADAASAKSESPPADIPPRGRFWIDTIYASDGDFWCICETRNVWKRPATDAEIGALDQYPPVVPADVLAMLESFVRALECRTNQAPAPKTEVER